MFRILHLSDLHASEDSKWSIDSLLLPAKQTILSESEKNNIDVVAFTGDIAFSGKKAEYDIARSWIDETFLSPTGLNIAQERLLFVPGNHDVDRMKRSRPTQAIEKDMLSCASQNDVANYYCDKNSLEGLLERHDEYVQFCNSVRGDNSLHLPGWTQRFRHGSCNITFQGYCTSWLSCGEDHRKLLIGQPQLLDRMKERGQDDGLCIAMMHHPLADLMEFDERNTDQHLRTHHHLLLRGHLHQPNMISRKTHSGGYFEIEAGALHERYERPNSFRIIDISDDCRKVYVRTFTWENSSWLLDLNHARPNGIYEYTIPDPPSPQSSVVGVGEQLEILAESHTAKIGESVSPESDFAAITEEADSRQAKEALKSFPRFQGEPHPQDIVIRQQLIEEALYLIESRRLVGIHSEWGTNPTAFVRSLAHRLRHQQDPPTILHARCGGASTGAELQTALAVNANVTPTVLGSALRHIGKCVMVLDDLEATSASSGELPTLDTLQTYLDYCPELVFITTSQGTASKCPTGLNSLTLGPLDAADTREYMARHHEHPVDLQNVVDYDRVQKATGGLPRHIDSFVESMAYTSFEDALSLTVDTTDGSVNEIPDVVTRQIDALAEATEDVDQRAYSLLTVLCILDKGESLSVLRRVHAQSPLWPKHAKMLEDLGVLDVIDSTPQKSNAVKEFSFSTHREKVLRVPRVIRDYVLSKLPIGDRRYLLGLCASLYFGSNWKSSALRVRSRLALSLQTLSHSPQNELAILKMVVVDAATNDKNCMCSPLEAATFALKYVDHLYGKGLYGEGYEAAKEALGLLENDPIFSVHLVELAELRLHAGKCARMVGDRTTSVELLSEALPIARESGVVSRIQDVVSSLALAHEGMGHKHVAITYAEEVVELAENNSADYLQAKAIIAGFGDDPVEKRKGLMRIERRARNNRHFTVADNIALELASDSDDAEETLKHLAQVRSRQSREYNYVRATLRRVETLLKAGRTNEISELDKRDLSRSYNMAYTQRLSGIFSWCHRVIWDYYEEIGDDQSQEHLFVHSSFIWRLNGDHDSEKRYVIKLQARDAKGTNSGGGLLSALGRYCRVRLRALQNGSLGDTP